MSYRILHNERGLFELRELENGGLVLVVDRELGAGVVVTHERVLNLEEQARYAEEGLPFVDALAQRIASGFG